MEWAFRESLCPKKIVTVYDKGQNKWRKVLWEIKRQYQTSVPDGLDFSEDLRVSRKVVFFQFTDKWKTSHLFVELATLVVLGGFDSLKRTGGIWVNKADYTGHSPGVCSMRGRLIERRVFLSLFHGTLFFMSSHWSALLKSGTVNCTGIILLWNMGWQHFSLI